MVSGIKLNNFMKVQFLLQSQKAIYSVSTTYFCEKTILKKKTIENLL